jgi:hypothetical protein
MGTTEVPVMGRLLWSPMEAARNGDNRGARNGKVAVESHNGKTVLWMDLPITGLMMRMMI